MVPELSSTSPVSFEVSSESPATFVLPTSFAQQRMWFLDRLEPGNPVYNIPLSLRLTGNLNVPALEGALNEIVRRHEILRTTFTAEENEPVQVVHPFVPFALRIVPLERVTGETRAQSIRTFVTAALQRAFDMERGPLFRVELLSIGETEYVLVMTVHHIVFDGWSRDVLLHELRVLYDAFARGLPSPLAELPIQYADFAVWQRNWLKGEVLDREIAFWQAQLQDSPPLLELPTDHARPAVQTYHGVHEAFSISPDVTNALETLSRRAGASLFMTLLASFQVLLYRYTGQSDILTGAPIANRNRPEIEKLIGFFVNTLVLRGALQEQMPFDRFLAQIRQTALDAYAHQDVPFEKLVEALQPARTLAYVPLVQVAINYLETHVPNLQIGDVHVEWAPVENKTTKFDLMWNVTHGAEGLQGHVEYSTDLFERATILRLIEHWKVLLENILAAPATPIGKLAFLTPTERKQLLVDWNSTESESPKQTLPELFQAQAARTPDAVAIIEGSERLTFQELDTRANQLAHHLIARGIGPETIVGVLLERSPRLLVALLAVWKAGGAYLWLDAAYPQIRLGNMLEQAHPQVVITEGTDPDVLAGKVPVLHLDRDAAAIARAPGNNPNVPLTLDNLAYVLLTSGSTGQPKGVMGLHRGMVNRLAWMWQTYPFAPGDVCAQKTSLHFVDSVAEIFGPLLQGVPLVLVSEEQVRDPNRLVATLARHSVTRLTLVPSLLRVLLHSPADLSTMGHLKLVTCSGEPLDAETVRAFYARVPHARLLNLYGGSEASADSLYFEIPRDGKLERVPIGRPLANTQVYILNSSLTPVPVGVAGEIYLGGAGVARGYLHRPDLTADKFIPNPFAATRGGDKLALEGSILYRTGDRARYLPDGTIEYLGRADRQVKVRGMRVELDEVEAALVTHPSVREGAVAFQAEDARLIGYFVPAPGDRIPVSELRTYLQERLPAHMLPSALVPLAQMPRTPSGKIDRRALHAETGTEIESTLDTVLPRDALETTLQAVWQRVLKRETIGVTDDFFDLGGHSLLAIVLFGEMERALGNELPRKVPLATLFQAPTIEKLAHVLRTGTPAREWSPLVPIQPDGTKPPFFCIHGFGGGVVGYGQLARLLGEDQPFYGLQARGQEENVVPDSNIEAMADRYVSAIRQQQPQGPYYLGGYCYGGTVALEVAQRLVAQGQEVRFLGMIENPAPKSQYRRFKPTVQNTQRFLKNLPYWAGDFIRLDWKHKWRRLEREIKQRTWHRAVRSAVSPAIPELDLRDVLDDVAPVPQQHQHLIRVHIGAMIRYQPQPYAGRVTVFRTRRQPLLCSHDPYLGWQELAAHVEVRAVAGSHHNLLEEPFVESLAAQLRASLEAAQQA